MDPRDLLAMISMRGNNPASPPGDPNALRFIPPDWWQGGGPGTGMPPPPQFMPSAPPPQGIDGRGGEIFQPPPPQGGFPLEGRTRMPNLLGSNQGFEGMPPPGIIPQQSAPAGTGKPGAGTQGERIMPRQYGLGQLI